MVATCVKPMDPCSFGPISRRCVSSIQLSPWVLPESLHYAASMLLSAASPPRRRKFQRSWMDFWKNRTRKAKQKFMVVFESLLSPWPYLGNCITTIIWLLTTNFQTKHHGPAPWPQNMVWKTLSAATCGFPKTRAPPRPPSPKLPQVPWSPLSPPHHVPCCLPWIFLPPLWLHTQSDVALGIQNMINMQCLVMT